MQVSGKLGPEPIAVLLQAALDRGEKANIPKVRMEMIELVEIVATITRLTRKRDQPMATFRSRIKTGWTFANVKLDKKQRENFIAWLKDGSDDLLELVPVILLMGYKLAARWDDENQTWIVTLTGEEGATINPNTSMSSRHSDFATALALAYYKHVIICDASDWADYEDAEDWG